jgi:hypothetical protein
MDFKLTRTFDNSKFEPFCLGQYSLSVQGGQFYYCTPRRDLASSDDYEDFEVAITVNGEWFKPNLSPLFQNKSWASYWSDDDVAPHVPREEVESMIIDILNSLV